MEQNHPTRPETGENQNQKKKRIIPIETSLGGNERNMGERGKNMKKYERVGKSLQVRARLSTISCYFPRAKIILGVLEMPCAPQKPKLAATTWKKKP